MPHPHLPAAIERSLRYVLGKLSPPTLEAVLVDLYRSGDITHHELGESLELDRCGVDALLKRRGVSEDLPTLEEHEAQVQALRRLLSH